MRWDRGVGSSMRHSDTLDTDLLYLARRIACRRWKAYFVRLAVPLAPLDHELHLLYAAMADGRAAGDRVAAALGFLPRPPACRAGARAGGFRRRPRPRKPGPADHHPRRRGDRHADQLPEHHG